MCRAAPVLERTAKARGGGRDKGELQEEVLELLAGLLRHLRDQGLATGVCYGGVSYRVLRNAIGKRGPRLHFTFVMLVGPAATLQTPESTYHIFSVRFIPGVRSRRLCWTQIGPYRGHYRNSIVTLW